MFSFISKSVWLWIIYMCYSHAMHWQDFVYCSQTRANGGPTGVTLLPGSTGSSAILLLLDDFYFFFCVLRSYDSQGHLEPNVFPKEWPRDRIGERRISHLQSRATYVRGVN